MRTLVTGATGFTGGHLARHLRNRGYGVRALVRGEDQRSAALAALGVELCIGDLTDKTALVRALGGVDIVYNIGATYRQAAASKGEYFATNARAVADLVEAGASAGVGRVVHCSTVGVHGDVERPPAGEDAPLRPGDEYQRSKLEGERLGRKAADQTGMDLVIARPSGIYGPGDRRLLKLFRGVARRRFVTLGRGDIYYHLTYVEDVAEGCRLCGEAPAAAGRTYILAGSEVTTLNELVRRIASAAGVRPPSLHLPVWPVWLAGAACEAVCVPFGVEPPLYRRRVDFFTKSRAFDIARARAELGFAPQVGLDEGIRRTLAWYREQGWL
jgi:nucleoside-diphosphate-sugar epimerase